MEYYIQSCGTGVDQDYSWQFVNKEKSIKSEILEIIKWINKFVQKDASSVFMGRKFGQLILFISNLESNTRFDYVGRKVRNSILFVSPSNAEEHLLQWVAAKAIKDTNLFANEVDRTVSFSSDEASGFIVHHPKLKELLTKDSVKLERLPTVAICKIGKNCSTLRFDLADEILHHQLPKGDGVLVVVTQYQDPKLFRDEKVWRGMSSLCTKDTWQVIPKNANTLLYASLIVLGVFMIGLFGWIWTKSNDSPIKLYEYMTIANDRNNRLILYAEPKAIKENSKEFIPNTPKTLVQVIEIRDKWFKIQICNNASNLISRDTQNLTQHTWISVDDFVGDKRKLFSQTVGEADKKCN